jgi:hypothetical protein
MTRQDEVSPTASTRSMARSETSPSIIVAFSSSRTCSQSFWISSCTTRSTSTASLSTVSWAVMWWSLIILVTIVSRSVKHASLAVARSVTSSRRLIVPVDLATPERAEHTTATLCEYRYNGRMECVILGAVVLRSCHHTFVQSTLWC